LYEPGKNPAEEKYRAQLRMQWGGKFGYWGACYNSNI
jgi:hypothetical protein